MPRVTIGLPVYNGGDSIADCLQNLANQDYNDFEVIISDNASTDGTSDICAVFAAKDMRFSHVRRDVTCPPMENFFWLRDKATSPLFAWRAHDDWSSPDYFRRLVACFDADPQTVLAAGSVVTRSYRASGEPRAQRFPFPGAEGAPGFRAVFRRLYKARASWIYGLWNRESLTEITNRIWSAYPDVWGFDHLCVASAILDGRLRGDTQAEFTQHMDRRPRSHGLADPTPQDMLDLRTRFGNAMKAEFDRRDWSILQRAALSLLLPTYMDHRLDHRRKIYKKLLKQRLGLD